MNTTRSKTTKKTYNLTPILTEKGLREKIMEIVIELDSHMYDPNADDVYAKYTDFILSLLSLQKRQWREKLLDEALYKACEFVLSDKGRKIIEKVVEDYLKQQEGSEK